MDIYLIALIANYLVFGALFFWRYLHPEKWSEWVVESSIMYSSMYLAATFIVVCLLAIAGGGCLSLVFALSLIILLFFLKGVIGGGLAGLIPFFLYLSTIIQEVYYAFTSPGDDAIIFLMVWYFIGAFLFLAFNKPIGAFIDSLNPDLSARHMKMIKKVFGESAPKVIMLKSGSIHANVASSPGGFAAIGLVYVVWMLLKHVIFYLVLL